jgi:hypothetical protein
MTRGNAIPPTRFGAAYRVLLIVGGLCAVVGIADAGRALFWLVLNGTTGSPSPLMDVVNVGLRAAAWGFVAVAAYTGWRRDAFPATWILVGITILAWALLLAQRYT